MKKILLIINILLFSFFSAQITNIKSGEFLKYRIHYGPLNAGYATLNIIEKNYKGIPHYYVKGYGYTTGAVKAFFRVEDIYESFINISTGLPSFYVRNVKEGSYRQHLETVFNHENHTLILTDKKTPTNSPKLLKTVKGVQDMLSAFYYLRNQKPSSLKPGHVLKMNIWIDDELFPFQLKVVGIEYKKTKFGKVECLKIIPSVMSGRVFKDKEGVTMWVTNDFNHIPVELKADLAVGSLKASLNEYKNTKYPINFIK